MKPDWARLASLLRQEWQESDFNLTPYHKGFFECAVVVAEAMRDATPRTRERRLFRLMADCLRGERAGTVG